MYVIFTDLDGTLLSDDKQVSAKNRFAITQALAGGNKIVITTGRPLPSALHLAEELGLSGNGCYLIASNGGLIYDCYNEQILFETGLPRAIVRTLMDEAKKRRLHIHTYTKDLVLAECRDKELTYYEGAIQLSSIVVPDAVSYLTYDPWKVILINRDSKDALLAFQKDMEPVVKEHCASLFSCEYMLEYCPFDATKGKGVDFLCRYLSLDKSHSIAIGDAENDISMIQTAGIGVAMSNASAITKEAADVITVNDNNHDGFAEILERYVL